MFSIFKKKYPAASLDFSALITDMHSHLLPGIDDGAPDPETSALLKKGLEDAGYRQFITTPHIMWDLYQNTAQTVAQSLHRLQGAGAHKNLRAAAEYFLDEHFDQLVKEGQPLLTIQDKMVLVEFSFVSAPIDLKEKIFALQISGYQPILAHPERYEYLLRNKSIFDDLKSMGCHFQLNLLSLAGYYGKTPNELAHWLISKNYIDFAGTDLHHLRHLQALRTSKTLSSSFSRLLESGQIRNNLLSI